MGRNKREIGVTREKPLLQMHTSATEHALHLRKKNHKSATLGSLGKCKSKTIRARGVVDRGFSSSS